MPHEHRSPGDPQCRGVQWDSKHVWVSALGLWWHGSPASPERSYFPFEPELTLNTESKHRCSRKRKWSRNHIIFFLVHVPSLCSPNTYTENDEVERKRVINTVSFPSNPSFTSVSRSQKFWVDVHWWKSELKEVELILWDFSTAVVTKIYIHVYDLPNMNHVIQVILGSS